LSGRLRIGLQQLDVGALCDEHDVAKLTDGTVPRGFLGDPVGDSQHLWVRLRRRALLRILWMVWLEVSSIHRGQPLITSAAIAVRSISCALSLPARRLWRSIPDSMATSFCTSWLVGISRDSIPTR
jgi:hypothetical protein